MILDLFRLNGKVAVVTGANTGLGQGFCVAFAEAGATVIGVARRSCAETAAKVEAVGGTFFEVLTDLSAPDASKTVVNACKKLTGRVDILVNNAGIIHREDAVNVTEANWDLVTNLNEKLVFFLSQATGPVWPSTAQMSISRNSARLAGERIFISGACRRKPTSKAP